MTTVQLFLIALFHLLHSSCLAESVSVSLGAPVRAIHIAYGGNCWDAGQVVQSIGGWVVWL